jgi:CBS domain-containing protein
MHVSSILKVKGTHVETVAPGTRIETAVWTLRAKDIGALVVSEDGATPVGVFSERDVVRGLTEHGRELLALPVSAVMSTPVVTCGPQDSLTALMARMTRHRIRHFPVIEDNRLCGIVSIGDVVKHRLDELELEANILREALVASH